MINFCYDRLGSNPSVGYPNLALPDLAPQEFDITWPRTLPLRLLVYLRQFGHASKAYLVDQAPAGAWYPIALGWHDFDCDYFALMSASALERLKKQDIRVLFYYHEGDHPGRIKQRLDRLCDLHHLARSCYLFVSSNSSASGYENFHYFNDHEYFLSYINGSQEPETASDSTRPFEFTALNRQHKWWRATVMSDLVSQGLMDHSQWSYNTQGPASDLPEENPISLSALPDWPEKLHSFLAEGPYVCDTSDSKQHNDHRHVNTDLYAQSYCHLVIETLFDADQSGGSFLTEKTYKCLKYGQPFVIIGPAGSLQVLRDSGYHVFDHAIDNSYDLITDNTGRWLAIRNSIRDIRSRHMHQWYLSCRDDVVHNQWNFSTKAHGALDRLVKILGSACKD